MSVSPKQTHHLLPSFQFLNPKNENHKTPSHQIQSPDLKVSLKMEEYPEELRTPPLPLISLLGCPELHPSISSHLHSECQPPINTLALPDFTHIHLLSKSSPIDPPSSPRPRPLGFLKTDWLLKHRTKIPSLVSVFFTSDRLSGDPTHWVQLCTHLDHLKGVIRTRNIKLVIVVVHSSSEDDINEDRMLSLRKRAEVESKCIVNFSIKDASELKQSLIRLGALFADLVNAYYREVGRQVRARAEKRNFNHPELGVRYCFKVAVYAEFRRDWVEALKFYEDAYHALREMVATSTRLPAIQRLVEIKILAEQLHFKITTLLLHGGKVIEAVLWFRQHCSSYIKLLGAAEVTFLHWEWVSRQYLVFAGLLETSSKSFPGFSSAVMSVSEKGLTEMEVQPAYYYQLASRYLREKSSCLELALSMSEVLKEGDDVSESVVPSSFVGQFARLLEPSPDEVNLKPLTDEEFVRYAITEGKRFQDTYEIIALLKKSREIYSGSKALRVASYCGFQMGKEYFSLGDMKHAKQYFDHALSLYRHEGWTTLLWEVLGYLRECSRKDGSLKGFVEYSLEMAALPVSSLDSFAFKECGPAGPPSLILREVVHKEVVGLVTGDLAYASNDAYKNLKMSKESPFYLEIDLVSPLRVVLVASVAFHEHVVKPGVPVQFTLSLLSQLPLPFEIDALDVQFNQSECNFSIQNSQRTPSAANFPSQSNYRVETAPALVLLTNEWLRLTCEVQSDRSGKLDCVLVTARIGSHFAICCRAESPASMNDVPLWKFEEYVYNLPTRDPVLALSGQKAIQVEEPDPQVELTIDAVTPALVGESFIVPVTITSKGNSVYSGELKVNLVDTSGGGLMSPRELDPHTPENHHVELLGVYGPGNDEKSLGRSDSISKVQHCFGLVRVPSLENEASWFCKLDIRWHRPKPIMLFVSLSYSPFRDDLNPQKVHVQKSVQIEGKFPVSISHHMMLPFRRDPLLLSRVKPLSDVVKVPSLPLNETSILIVSAKNCAEVPLRILSMKIDGDDNALGSSCTVCSAGNQPGDTVAPNLLVPGEVYKKVFTVTPVDNTSTVRMGTVSLKWVRESGHIHRDKYSVFGVVSKHRLPDTNAELSPVIVSLECPPHAVLSEPFTYFIKIQNQTELLQEIKYLLLDSQSFVSSGSHNDTVFVLPKSEHVLSYKLVPLASGSQHLPKVTVTATRYSAAFRPSAAASTIYVFPTKPQLGTKMLETNAQSATIGTK